MAMAFHGIPTTYHPIPIAVMQLMFPRFAFCNFLSLGDNVQFFDDSMVVLHKIRQILMNCPYK